jgi:hypothetical protein
MGRSVCDRLVSKPPQEGTEARKWQSSKAVIVTPKGVLRLAKCNASATRKGP